MGLAWRNTFAGGQPATVLLDVSGAVSGTAALGPVESYGGGGGPAGTYTGQLRAATTAGVSAPSNPVTLTVPGPCSGAPEPPERFLAYRIDRTLHVVWEPPASGAAPAGYAVDVGGAWTGSLPTVARAMSGAVVPGTYRLRVRAINTCGSSVATPEQVIAVP